MSSDELESEWSTTTQVDGAGQPALAMASILEHEIHTTSPRCKHNVGTNVQFKIINCASMYEPENSESRS